MAIDAIIAIRAGFGTLLLLAAIRKIRNPHALHKVAMELFPLRAGVRSTAIGALIGVEMILGALLMSGLWLRIAAFANAVLFGVFLGVLALLYRRGGAGCGCFGGWGDQRPVRAVVLLRGILLFIASIALCAGIVGDARVHEPLWMLGIGTLARSMFWIGLVTLLYLLLEAREAVVHTRSRVFSGRGR